MVKADGGNHGQLRHQEVGRIQPPAKAGLDDGDVHLFIGKPAEGHAGGDFEETEVFRLEVRFPSAQKCLYVVLGDHLSADPGPFAEVHQVGRCVKPGLVSRHRQCRCQHIGHGTLAVGAGDMDAFELARGIAKDLVKCPHALQTRLVRTGLEALFLHGGKAAEDVRHQLPVTVHNQSKRG